MTYVIAAILVGTLAFAFSQAYLIRKLRKHYSQPVPVWPEDRPWPQAAIVLSLRGNDPFLETCLRNLIKQDYPDFFVQIVVDSESDPAWEMIRVVQAECNNTILRVSVLNERRDFCSLKNSSIIQAVNGLPAKCEVVAFVDADAITHSTWLRELVAPLADPEVGGSTGIRWFAPTEAPMFGTRIRCYWNLVASSMMFHTKTPWGGSMVVRRSVLDSGLAEEWTRMFCEDVHTISHLEQRQLKLAYVPQATVVNTETTTVSACVNFVNRQMLILRLYHRQWWQVVALIASVTTLHVFQYTLIVSTMIAGDWISFLALIGIRPISMFAVQFESKKLDRVVRETVSKSGREIAKNPSPEFIGYTFAEGMFLTSMLYAVGARFVSWRGIKYKVNGPQDITMLAYKPYFDARLSTASSQSTIV